MGEKRSWEPMSLRYVGHVSDTLPSRRREAVAPTTADSGESGKPKGQG
jgi:hypothetical protein